MTTNGRSPQNGKSLGAAANEKVSDIRSWQQIQRAETSSVFLFGFADGCHDGYQWRLGPLFGLSDLTRKLLSLLFKCFETSVGRHPFTCLRIFCLEFLAEQLLFVVDGLDACVQRL